VEDAKGAWKLKAGNDRDVIAGRLSYKHHGAKILDARVESFVVRVSESR